MFVRQELFVGEIDRKNVETSPVRSSCFVSFSEVEEPLLFSSHREKTTGSAKIIIISIILIVIIVILKKMIVVVVAPHLR